MPSTSLIDVDSSPQWQLKNERDDAKLADHQPSKIVQMAPIWVVWINQPVKLILVLAQRHL